MAKKKVSKKVSKKKVTKKKEALTPEQAFLKKFSDFKQQQAEDFCKRFPR